MVNILTLTPPLVSILPNNHRNFPFLQIFIQIDVHSLLKLSRYFPIYLRMSTNTNGWYPTKITVSPIYQSSPDPTVDLTYPYWYVISFHTIVELPVCHSARTTGVVPMPPPIWPLAMSYVVTQNDPTFFLGSLHAPITPIPGTSGPAGTWGEDDKIFHAPYLYL